MIKQELKMISVKYPALAKPYKILRSIVIILFEKNERARYYNSIDTIKKGGRIIMDLKHGGIGDWLVFTTLPRLLKETYNIDFYLSKKSLSVVRNLDTLKLCFEMNPYFKGVSSEGPVFSLHQFECEKSWKIIFSDAGGENIIETLERQFGVKGSGVPEIYYKPKILEDFKDVILIDKNYISGKKLGWKYKNNAFEEEASRHLDQSSHIEYVNPSKQDLFRYVDMIYSCKYFVVTFSGGASIAACFDKPFSVLWPRNAINKGNYQFVFTKSKGNYIK